MAERKQQNWLKKASRVLELCDQTLDTPEAKKLAKRLGINAQALGNS